jgi:uncharacterized membrane protein YkvA (DUF1232 family)
MTDQPNHNDQSELAPARSPEERAGLIRELINRSILTWRLFWDRRVGFLPKLIPLLGIAYLVSPIDLLAEVPLFGIIGPLAYLDDVGLILLALNLFVQASPPDIVREHLRELGARHIGAGDYYADDEEEGEIVEGTVEEVE